MGTWKISIDGHGIHHNKLANDANELMKDFVRCLIAAGHDISRAEFTLTGSTDDVLSQAKAQSQAPAPAPGQCVKCGERDGTHGSWCGQ